MAGGGSKKDESLVINSTNVFAALDTLKKKKKTTKEQGKSKASASKKPDASETEKPVFWAPGSLSGKSWADIDDEDDDDYFATNAPVWSGAAEEQKGEEDEESESEIEGLEEVDDADEEEHEPEPEAPVEKEPVIKTTTEAPQGPKDTGRQLSKKELKKKGLEELDAVLAELGYLDKQTTTPEQSSGAAQGKKPDEHTGEVDKKEKAPGESKNAKKKKKKDKSSKDSKETPDQNDADTGKGLSEAAETERAEDTPVDVKERLKKAASMKKKKTTKEMDAAARAAAIEAAARNAKLAASKKKEKGHYNQQPVR